MGHRFDPDKPRQLYRSRLFSERTRWQLGPVAAAISNSSFGLPTGQNRPTILRTGRFSPNLRTPDCRYGSQNSILLNNLWASAESGSAASLGWARASAFLN